MQKTYNMQLELETTYAKTTLIDYISGDQQAMPIYIDLFARGEPFIIPDNATIKMNFENPNGFQFTRDAVAEDRENGHILYEIKGGDIAIAVAGSVTARVIVISGSQRMTWQGFKFNVTRSFAGWGNFPEEHQAWYDELMQRISELEKIIEELQGGAPTQPYTGAIVGRAVVGKAIVGKVA